ncbi:MAG: Mth938-like domain-containing protein [Betaproteobacteria bacterium]|nr:Mth938-like domain-containing protein [Betaproteobacteria bacterium]
MKLHLAQASGQNMFTGYGAGYVAINAVRYEHHLLVTSDRVMAWDISGFDALDAAHVEQLIALKPEIVILGTGATLRFPQTELSRRLAAAGIGFEVMDSKAACRTYNVLVAEGRHALAAILVA